RWLPAHLGAQHHIQRLVLSAVASATFALAQMLVYQRIFTCRIKRKQLANIVAVHCAHLPPNGESRIINGLVIRGCCCSTLDDCATASVAGGCSWACNSAARRSLPRRIWLLTVFSGISST